MHVRKISLALASALALAAAGSTLAAPPPGKGGGNGGGGNDGGDTGGSAMTATFPALGTLSPALTEDGLGLYVDGTNGAEVWFNSPGNLIFNTGSRTLHVTLQDTTGNCTFGGPGDPVSEICAGGEYFGDFFRIDAATHCRTDADLLGHCNFDQMSAGDSRIFQIRYTIEAGDGAVYKLRFGTECLPDPDSGIREPVHSNELIMYFDGTDYSFDTKRQDATGTWTDVEATLCRDVTTGKGKRAVTETVWTSVNVSFDMAITP